MLAPLLLLACAAAAPQQHPGIPSPIERVYVVEMSHLDVGFTEPPSVVRQQSWEHIRNALGIRDRRPEFRWTIESAWQAESFLALASAADVRRLRQRLADGSFVLGGGYLNPHSGLWGEEELHRFVHPAAQLAARLGGRFDAVLLDDVPGFTLAMPRVLANSGVRYLLLGKNDFVGGDPDIPLADRPFWWEGRDGSRVLTWLTYGSYAEGFVEWGFLNLQTAFNHLSQRLPEYEAAGYPYDAVLVMRGFDNADASEGMAALAAQWNATYDNPELILATPQEFFAHLEAKYGDVFPTYRGDSGGMWESVSSVTPASNALVRRRRAALADVEALRSALALHDGLAYPLDELGRAWKLAMVFDEHSGGGMPWPGLMTQAEAVRQNREYVGMARRLDKAVSGIESPAVFAGGAARVPAGEAGLVLFNPLGAAWEGVVEVDCGGPQPADLRLADPSGGPDASFRWLSADRSRLALQAGLPAHGWRRWRITAGGNAPPPPAEQPGTRLAAGGLELRLDPATGTAAALVEVATGFDWLAGPGPHRFGGIERGTNQKVFFGKWSPADPQPVQVLVEDPAPLFRRARILDKHGHTLRRYTLFEAGLRLDVEIVARRSELPFVPLDSHSVHYGVSFAWNLDLPATLRVDGPDGWYVPGAESLPGVGLGHFASATGALLTGASGRWLGVSSLDSSILDLGEMDGSARATVEDDEAALTWKLRRHADLAEVEGGAVVPIEAEPGMPDETAYRFVIRGGRAGDATPDRESLRRDLAPPLAAWVAAGSGGVSLPAEGSFLDLQGASLVCWKRAESDDGWILRLRGGSAGGSAVLTPPVVPSEAFETDLLERPRSPLVISAGTVTVPLAPGGVTTVLLRD